MIGERWMRMSLLSRVTRSEIIHKHLEVNSLVEVNIDYLDGKIELIYGEEYLYLHFGYY